MNCRKCSIELIDDNWYPSNRKCKNYICNKCTYLDRKEQYQKDGKSRYNLWAQKKGFKNYNEYNNWIIQQKGFNNIQEYRNWLAQNQGYNSYYSTPNGKLAYKKCIAKRRKLGYNVINVEDIYNSDYIGHHIDTENVLFIPEKLHKSIWHSQNDIKSMKEINKIAFEWYNNTHTYRD